VFLVMDLHLLKMMDLKMQMQIYSLKQMLMLKRLKKVIVMPKRLH